MIGTVELGTHVNFIEFPNLKNIRELKLHCNFVSRCPAAINKLPQVRLLDLGSNSIPRLSIELLSLQHMRVLSLYENHIHSLPRENGMLRQLRVLDISKHLICTVLAEIGRLLCVTEFGLGDCKLRSLQEEIGCLLRLKIELLKFKRKTQLMKFPEQLGRLRALEQICLNYCGLSSVTVTSGGMVSLTYLGLQNNDLKFVPPELSNFKRLKTLHLFGNRLTSEPSIEDILSS